MGAIFELSTQERLNARFNSLCENFVNEWSRDVTNYGLTLAERLANAMPLNVDAARESINHHFCNAFQVVVANGFSSLYISGVDESLNKFDSIISSKVKDMHHSYFVRGEAIESMQSMIWKLQLIIKPSELLTILDSEPYMSQGANHGQIMKFIERGLKNSDISKELGCNVKTVLKAREMYNGIMAEINKVATAR